MTSIKLATVLAVLLGYQPFELDLPETKEERAIRLTPYAIEITAYANTFPKGWGAHETAASLLEIGDEESKFAKYVTEGCKVIPKGAANCDTDYKGRVRALTPWQLHERTCPEVFATEPGSIENIRAGIRCAAKTFRGAYYFCDGKNPHGKIAGAFSGYRSLSLGCTWQPAYQRSLDYTTTLARLWQPCAGSGCEL